jgi:hypothetical protein
MSSEQRAAIGQAPAGLVIASNGVSPNDIHSLSTPDMRTAERV